MRVTLVSPNRVRLPDPLLPIGAATAAAVLRNSGSDVRILDLCHEPDPLAAVRRHLREWPPDIVGLSLRTLENNQLVGNVSYLDEMRGVVAAIREVSSAPIVAGGAAFSLFPAELLEALDLPYGLAGEAEQSLAELAECITDGRAPTGISGACQRTADSTVANPPARVRSFGEPVVPAYDLVDCPAYVSQGAVIPIESKRGCDLRCSFCPDGADRLGTRPKPPAVVVDEIEALTALVGTKRLHFNDGVFHYPPSHAEAVCQEILRRSVEVRWQCGVNPAGLSLPLLRIMREAGCRGVALGLDAATGPMLRNYRKGFAEEDIAASVAALRSARLPFSVHLLFGGPGETDDTVDRAMEFLESLVPDEPLFIAVGLRIYPGTTLEQTARMEGRMPPGHNMLEPTYYLSRELSADVLSRLEARCDAHPRWFTVPGLLKARD